LAEFHVIQSLGRQGGDVNLPPESAEDGVPGFLRYRNFFGSGRVTFGGQNSHLAFERVLVALVAPPERGLAFE
jgi:hypothetical protein